MSVVESTTDERRSKKPEAHGTVIMAAMSSFTKSFSRATSNDGGKIIISARGSDYYTPESSKIHSLLFLFVKETSMTGTERDECSFFCDCFQGTCIDA
jgi:hypothetical protein